MTTDFPRSHGDGINQEDLYQRRLPTRYKGANETKNKKSWLTSSNSPYLDEEIGKSKNLRKAAPLQLVAVGGFVAVSYFQNRTSTEDLDYMIDPTLENLSKIEDKLVRAIKNVADKKGYDEGWVNDKGPSIYSW
ncbi:hypothetical protein ACJ73_03163 [Blastomyces percursus]|uniref:Uncharacterized protein n=1 Tax=Blastomyces percursus TaxID=1658174 RepID=A0A1J9QZ64_9EURO|nr:hypothetical protein ACJ73_03163 [Blastomyces percursus]